MQVFYEKNCIPAKTLTGIFREISFPEIISG